MLGQDRIWWGEEMEGRFIVFSLKIHCAEKYVAVHHHQHRSSIGNFQSEHFNILVKIFLIRVEDISTSTI